jgi:predicted permease
MLFGVLPALRTTRGDPSRALKGHAVQAVGGRGAARLRGALGTAQIAFSMVLLALAGLFAQSLANVARIDLGIDVDSLASFSISPRRNGYDAGRTSALYDRIEQEFAAQPGVTGVASAAVPVMAGGSFQAGLVVEGFDSRGEPVEGSFNVVGPRFFETLSIPLLAGREFTAADVSGSSRVAIVSERFARNYGLEGGAIGRRLRFGPDDSDGLEIVGVVADAAYSAVKEEVPAQFFVPLSRVEGQGLFSFFAGSATYYVRAAIDPDALLRTIPAVVASVDSTLPVSNVITLRRQAQENIFVDRLVTVLSAGFAGLATLLAAIGLYGMLSYSVAQRTRELGLRLALGAEPADIGAIVLRQIGVIAAVGIAIGFVGAIGAGRAAEALLFGLSGYEPLVLVAAAIVLGAVVFVAGYLPARRASRIAPMEALRYE